MCELVLLRHGETAGQSSVRFYGSTDIELSESGKEQMKRAGDVLRQQTFKTIITSPLRRSRDSASIALNGHSVELLIIEHFREIHFGEFEGLTKKEIEERNPDFYKKWHKSGTFSRFPGGESKIEFYNRIKEAALDVFNRVEFPALAVLHKGVIRGIISALLDVPPNELTGHPIELGSIHRLRKVYGIWKLVKENEIDHLGDLRIKHS